VHNAEYNFEHGILMTPAITSCSPCFPLVFYLILLAGSFLLSVSLDEGLPILSIYSHIFFVSILHSMFQPDIWIILRFAGKPAKMLRVMIKKVPKLFRNILLAAYIIKKENGMTADKTISRLSRIRGESIQSKEQEKILFDYEKYVRN
jgi:hypothetical protein